MVLFQPPSGPSSPFDVGEYQWASTLLWITSIIGIIWGFLLIVSYINTRKRHHLVWGASFSIIWIGFHQVISMANFEVMITDGFMAAMFAFIPGLLAAGLLMAVFSDKKIIGNLYALFALIMAIAIGFAKFDPFQLLDAAPFVPSIIVVSLHIPSALIIVILPLLTTLKKETRWPALFMTIGGILFGLVGGLLSLVLTGVVGFDPVTGIDWRYAVMGSFSIILLFAALAFMLGTIIPAKWNFEIPGIEFEERA